jgi:hypothetical protein
VETIITSFTVADYCEAMGRGDIVVNQDYQRSDKVWPQVARSYLIETILLGFPMPKLSLYQVTDVATRKTYKEIVDGQQRSKAIYDFYHDRLELSPGLDREDLTGATFTTLGDDLKASFLNYAIPVDLFVAATSEEVRETFRRMNSYTVPLNPEEHRHAVFQGRFKWFIHKLARRYEKTFLELGVFSEKQLVRMADTKLLAELTHALLHGITTTRRASLDKLYKDNDRAFDGQRRIATELSGAMDQIIEWPELHKGTLMKPYLAYSLLLAFIHMREPQASLQEHYGSHRLARFNRPTSLTNLTALAEAIENPEEPGPFAEFVAACTSKTNVASQRTVRFTWMCRALAGQQF